MRIAKMWMSVLAVMCVMTLLAGCGSKPADTAAEKVAEKALEKALSADGQKVDVKVDKDSGAVSMTITAKEGDVTSNVAYTKELAEQAAQEAAREAAEQAAVDTAEQALSEPETFTMSMQSAEGNITVSGGANAKIPEAFPKDVPLYPEMKLMLVQSAPDQQAYILQGQTTDSMDKVAAHIKKEAAAQGWTETLSMHQPGDPPMQMMGYTKDSRALNYVLNAEGGGTIIHINLAAE